MAIALLSCLFFPQGGLLTASIIDREKDTNLGVNFLNEKDVELY